MKKLLIMAFAMCAGLSLSAQDLGTIRVKITGFGSVIGNVSVGLYSGEENFLEEPVKGLDQIVDGEDVIVVFENVPYGEYAISLYHDKNENGKMDFNFMGIPTEKYAFSNNANGMFGPPPYEECVFTLEANELEQVIKL